MSAQRPVISTSNTDCTHATSTTTRHKRDPGRKELPLPARSRARYLLSLHFPIEQQQARAWLQIAQQRWPQAPWVRGTGPYAVIGCKGTVTLWPSITEAEAAAAWIDRLGCGGGCNRRHLIVDLEATP